MLLQGEQISGQDPVRSLLTKMVFSQPSWEVRVGVRSPRRSSPRTSKSGLRYLWELRHSLLDNGSQPLPMPSILKPCKATHLQTLPRSPPSLSCTIQAQSSSALPPHH